MGRRKRRYELLYTHWVPKGKPRHCLFTKKWGLQSKPRLVCLLWGEGKRRYELLYTHWVPKGKPRHCLFTFGKAEVHVA